MAAEEIQGLKDQIAHLTAENERLLSEQVAPSASTSAGSSAVPAASTNPSIDRLVYIPRDRKCPMFRGHTGISLSEWVEEVEACMRARHLSRTDQAYYMIDHLEGEARSEIRYRSHDEQKDPDQIISILQNLYGCADSYVALQEAFFSRKQQEGETLQEFSLALLSLMAKVKACAPNNMPNSETLLRDQFIEHVLDGALRRMLKQYVRQHPGATLLVVREEAMRWEREGLPASARGRSHSVSSAYSLQYSVHGGPSRATSSSQSEIMEVKELLKKQQEQLDRLTQSIALLQAAPPQSRSPHPGPIICKRCHRPGHIARECRSRASFRQQPSLSDQTRSNQQSEN